jgi:serine/threonine-protein kinase HipA
VTQDEPVLDGRTVQTADVLKRGQRAAQLKRTENGIEFSYLKGYLSDNGTPVATTLPLSSEPKIYRAGAVPPFFAGMLPEGRRLFALRRQVKTSADDELSLLLAVGADVVGDVQVVPEGVTPTQPDPLISVSESFTEVSFARILGEAGLIDRTGIPGVQDKASAQMISVPASRAGARYILKVDPPDYPNVVENEHYFINLARAAGITCVDADLVTDAEGRYGLLVRRFDRMAVEGESKPLACEDACQLLDLWPADKYNVTSEQVTNAISKVCPAGPVAARDVFRQLTFAWLTGNGDVHAKNLSVLDDGSGEFRVAPAYDLPSTLPYRDFDLALPMQGKKAGLSRRVMLEFAETIGVPSKAAGKIIDDLLDATSDVIDELTSGALPFDQRVISDWVRNLRDRRRHLSDRAS